jgi:hypothetical protein
MQGSGQGWGHLRLQGSHRLSRTGRQQHQGRRATPLNRSGSAA